MLTMWLLILRVPYTATIHSVVLVVVYNSEWVRSRKQSKHSHTYEPYKNSKTVTHWEFGGRILVLTARFCSWGAKKINNSHGPRTPLVVRFLLHFTIYLFLALYLCFLCRHGAECGSVLSLFRRPLMHDAITHPITHTHRGGCCSLPKAIPTPEHELARTYAKTYDTATRYIYISLQYTASDMFNITDMFNIIENEMNRRRRKKKSVVSFFFFFCAGFSFFFGKLSQLGHNNRFPTWSKHLREDIFPWSAWSAAAQV